MGLLAREEEVSEPSAKWNISVAFGILCVPLILGNRLLVLAWEEPFGVILYLGSAFMLLLNGRRWISSPALGVLGGRIFRCKN